METIGSAAPQEQSYDYGLITGILAGLLTILEIYYHIKTFSYWSSRGIKGPTPWPVLGTNIHYMLEHKLTVDERWRKKYGQTYGIYEGYIPVLRTTDNRIIRSVWIENFSSATDRASLIVHKPAQKRWMFWSSGDHWRNQRAIIGPLFTTLKLKTMFRSLTVCINRFKDEIESRLAIETTRNPIEVGSKIAAAELSKDELMSHSLGVIARTFFGLNLDTYRDKKSEFYKRAFAFAQFDFGWFLIWMLIPNKIRRLLEWDLTRFAKYEYFENLSQSLIDERRRKSNSSQKQHGTDVIQMLLDSEIPDSKEDKVKIFTKQDEELQYNNHIGHEELERYYKKQIENISFRKLSDDEIRSQMTFFFLAGFETTSSTLSFCFYELAHHQEDQEKVYQEIKEKGIINEPSDLSSLKQLDAFVSETMRMHAPVIEQNRMVTIKSGLLVPTNPPIKLDMNVWVTIPCHILHKEPEYWPEPEKFDTTRFHSENKHNIITCSYAPFGLGARNCVGGRFAILTVKSTIASVLLKYKVLPGPKSTKYPPDYNNHSFFLQLTNSDFVLVPRGDQ